MHRSHHCPPDRNAYTASARGGSTSSIPQNNDPFLVQILVSLGHYKLVFLHQFFWSSVSLSWPLSSRSSHLHPWGPVLPGARLRISCNVSRECRNVACIAMGREYKGMEWQICHHFVRFCGSDQVALVACEKCLGDNAVVPLTIFVYKSPSIYALVSFFPSMLLTVPVWSHLFLACNQFVSNNW